MRRAIPTASSTNGKDLPLILGHVFGIPLEETTVQLTSAGEATVTVIAIAGRTKLGQLQRRFRRRKPGQEH